MQSLKERKRKLITRLSDTENNGVTLHRRLCKLDNAKIQRKKHNRMSPEKETDEPKESERFFSIPILHN